jgi:putative ABC transport system permease protein
MFKNYILIALRQFSRHKLFSGLNVFGLAVGISFCLLIGQFILHERAVNAGLRNIQQQYFLNSDWKVKNTGPEITTIGALPKTLKTNYPALVAGYYRFNPVTNVVSAGDKHFKEDVAIGDTSLVTMYGYPLLYGDPRHAFVNNSSAVITEELALKLFGDKNAIDKTVTFTNTTGTTQDYKVSAVLRSIPYNTVNTLSLSGKAGYALFLPFEGNQYYPGGTGEDSWSSFFTVCFIQLQPGVNPEQLAAPVKMLLTTNSPETISRNLKVSFKPLDTYYLTANNGAVAKTLAILSLVALCILLLAAINFVNIMIGTSSYRLREIGLRKVFGGLRSELIVQYLMEATVLAFFAAILSICFYGLFRPFFNDLLVTDLLPLQGFRSPQFGFLILLALIVGLLAGIYPALVLSGSKVVNSVKGKLESVEKGSWLRKSLLVTQFTIAIGVFIFSLTLSKQVNYFFNKDLGYDKDQLMVVMAFPKQWDSAGVAKMESIRNSLLRLSSIKDASLSFDIPERVSPGQFQVNPEGPGNNQAINLQSIQVDEKYASTFGLHLLQGKFFKDAADGFSPGETVINQSAMKAFGWTDAVGKKLRMTSGGVTLTVIGVVKDFHLASLHETISPLILVNVRDTKGYRYLTLKLKAGNLASSIEQARAKWKEVSPGAPFEYFFMDERLQAMYQSELQLKKAAGLSTGLMLLIVLLGIFGVLTIALAKRTKEIAVRKILGAEVHHILKIFIRQYAGLLLISNLIAWPLAYYYSNQWLRQFAYRIPQPLSNYFIAAILVSVIAFLLISLQCLKVALINPVKSLKAE